MIKKTSRQIQAENTKAHILAVAKELLQHRTFDEISIQDICKKADVSVGAFYHHFENKTGIVVEIYRDIDLFFFNEVLESVTDEEPIEAIILYLVTQCQYALNSGKDLVKNIYKAQIENGNTFFLSKERGLPEGLRRLVLRAIDENKIRRDVSADLLIEELLILARGIIYYWCVSDGNVDMLEYARRMTSNYIRSYQI
ncbi:TetR/AcrR family transcriptional regulator [Clostridium sp. CX1]|uniref:TetR/AcrR family transcriptional regulator n=1 Tax=Clostridium sp. CX1 TaxID=2978346 RepID=UPI0021BE3FE6|nr:TetR/AcrR family transcriptional regulator [Clostridium sp. CX1]MCT8978484.1 TetR/AcrR family transcriptional regulator [Clostridium sp. CX1]